MAVVQRQVCRQVENHTDVLVDVNMVSSTRLGCVGCRLLRCVGMSAEGVNLEFPTQTESDRLQDRSTGGRGGGSLHGVLVGRNVYRPLSLVPVVWRELVGGPGRGPGIKRASDPVPHCAHGEGAAGSRSLDDPGFSAPFAQRDPFPPLDFDATRNQRSLQGSKAVSCFARYPDRRPRG